MNDAVNESNAIRFILMFRVWHPELTKTEWDVVVVIEEKQYNKKHVHLYNKQT